jgi:hypothetical protein
MFVVYQSSSLFVYLSIDLLMSADLICLFFVDPAKINLFSNTVSIFRVTEMR